MKHIQGHLAKSMLSPVRHSWRHSWIRTPIARLFLKKWSIFRRQHPTSKKHPSEGFGIAPKKGKKKKTKKKEPKHERQHPTSKKYSSEGFGIAPKKGKKKKEPKHERQQPTSKKHPSEGFGIAPKKGLSSHVPDSHHVKRSSHHVVGIMWIHLVIVYLSHSPSTSIYNATTKWMVKPPVNSRDGVVQPFCSEETVCIASSSTKWMFMRDRISLLNVGPWFSWNAKFGYITIYFHIFRMSSETNTTRPNTLFHLAEVVIWSQQARDKPQKTRVIRVCLTRFFWPENVVNFPQAAPDEQETPKRGIWHRPQKRQKKKTKKKRTQARKAAPDEQESPKRGIWHRPQKRSILPCAWLPPCQKILPPCCRYHVNSFGYCLSQSFSVYLHLQCHY